MSKAFTKESDGDDDQPEKPELNFDDVPNYMTPTGFANLQNELRHLLGNERPKMVETVRWAAGNGDRSENGDYIYGKRRLREIDKRVRYLTKRLETAKVIDPNLQKNLTKVFFGATVTIADKDQQTKTVQLVGMDEADLAKDKISWLSPLAKALLKAEVDDEIKVQTPAGVEVFIVIAIHY